MIKLVATHLVQVIYFATNNLFETVREVTDTKNEIRARYVDGKNRNKIVKDTTIGGHSWKKDGEIFPRCLEDRYGRRIYAVDQNKYLYIVHLEFI